MRVTSAGREVTSEFLPEGWTTQGRRGIALVVAGPSGAGKSSVIEETVRRDPGLAFSVSATTRPKRPEEEHGRDYYFVSDEAFERMVGEGQLLEWTMYQGQRYGTPRSEVEGRLASGRDVLLNVEVRGALAIRGAGLAYPVVLVFLVPPSRKELIRRLMQRGTESKEALERRMAIADEEVACIPSFDYLVINDRLEAAVERIEALLAAERCRIVPCCA